MRPLEQASTSRHPGVQKWRPLSNCSKVSLDMISAKKTTKYFCIGHPIKVCLAPGLQPHTLQTPKENTLDTSLPQTRRPSSAWHKVSSNGTLTFYNEIRRVQLQLQMCPTDLDLDGDCFTEFER